MNTHYQFYEPEIFERTIQRNLYEINEDKPFYPLQKFAAWVLRKLGCLTHPTEKLVNTVTINSTSITELVQEYILSVGKQTGGNIKYIILGHDQLLKLNIEIQNQLTFPVTLHQITDHQITDFHYGTFYDAKIVLAPHFDGIVILTELL